MSESTDQKIVILDVTHCTPQVWDHTTIVNQLLLRKILFFQEIVELQFGP